MDSHKPHDSQAPPTAEHGHGGSLGVDITSYQPLAEAPASLHFSQVPQNFHSVGAEPKVAPLTPSTSQKAELVHDAPSQSSLTQPELITASTSNQSTSTTNPAAPDEDFWKDTPKNPQDDSVINTVIYKASEIFEDVRGRAVDSFGDLKEKASEAWHAVAGVVGAAPGKELREDQTERIVAGGPQSSSFEHHGQELGVGISSYQPPVNSPAGNYFDQLAEQRRLSMSSESDRLRAEGVIIQPDSRRSSFQEIVDGEMEVLPEPKLQSIRSAEEDRADRLQLC